MARDYPAGYSSVRSEQVIKADRELWTILAQEYKESLKPTNDVPALNQAFKALTTDPRVTMYLLPVPSSVPKVSNNTTTAGPPKAPPPTKPQQGPGINKRRKLTRAQKGCPQELKDFDLKFSQGTVSGPTCWGYNLKGGCCNETLSQNGCSRCKRGYHVFANCHKPGHSVVTCRSLKTKAWCEGPASAHKRIRLDHSDNSCDSMMGSNAYQGPQVFADFSAAQPTAGPQQTLHPFSGLELQDLLVVEICAGSARLTKTVRSKGMRGLAIDKTKNRSCGTEIMVLDLTLEQDLRILLQLLKSESKRIALVFISSSMWNCKQSKRTSHQSFFVTWSKTAWTTSNIRQTWIRRCYFCWHRCGAVWPCREAGEVFLQTAVFWYDTLIHALNLAGKKSAIYECEFFALFCVFLVWSKDVSSAVFFYTDNNDVRDALIAGHATNALARKIVVATLGLEVRTLTVAVVCTNPCRFKPGWRAIAF